MEHLGSQKKKKHVDLYSSLRVGGKRKTGCFSCADGKKDREVCFLTFIEMYSYKYTCFLLLYLGLGGRCNNHITTSTIPT